MKLYQVRDIVRENVGREAVADHFLNWAMDMALREIEKTGNYYWMRTSKDSTLVVDQQTYPITTSTSSGLNLPSFKDIRILLVKDSTLDNPDFDEVLGPVDVEDVELIYAENDEGQPMEYSITETSTGAPSLVLWPPNPDKTYAIRLYHYEWTSLPTDPTAETHELLKRFPEALIYKATEIALTSIHKDPQYAMVWRLMFDNPGSKQDPGELTKIRRFDRDRQFDSRMDLRPQRGPYVSSRWRRNREVWR